MKNEKEHILHKITKLKKKKTGFLESNIFTIPDKIMAFEEDENGIVFLINDKGVKRAYFCVNNISSLKTLLNKMPVNTGIEIITNHLNEITEDSLEAAGYHHVATYLRASNKSLKDTFDKNIPEKFKKVNCETYVQIARTIHLDEIYTLLYETFNPLTSHLQSKEELKSDIEKNKVTISIINNKIKALLTYEFQGKKLYMEHALNHGDSILMHSLYFSVLEYAVSNGINFAYTWMRDDNDRVLAFAKRYGIIPDGIKNYVYLKETK